MLGAIEVNDTGVCLAAGGDVLLVSPGYALIGRDGIIVGDAARERASLEPHRVNSRFWQELSTTPLPYPVPGARMVIDLVHLHLAHIWERAGRGLDRVILTVPGRYSETQLGLLLGVAQTLHLPVTGLIDNALAVAREPCPDRRLLHLELALHSVRLTVLEQGRRLRPGATYLLDENGSVELEDTMVRYIADQFVQETRFDPLHRALGEQTLRAKLPGLLGGLNQEWDVNIELQSGDGRTHTLAVSKHSARGALKDRCSQIVDLVETHRGAGPAVLELSNGLLQVPGLTDLLRALPDVELVGLPPGAAAIGAIRRSRQIRSPQGNSMTKSLPWHPRPVLTPPSSPPPGAGTGQGDSGET